MESLPRPEHPRPQFRRSDWANLNGQWSFAFDDADEGRRDSWEQASAHDLCSDRSPFQRRITVPYCYQAALSGIGDRALHDVVWYARVFADPRAEKGAEVLLLHFGAVDYAATVWVNGTHVAEHEGGHTPFSTDITHALEQQENVLVVRVEDPSRDLTVPRGKQYWKEQPEGIFYPPTTGIWQTVWLEPVSRQHVSTLRITPDVDRASVDIDVSISAISPATSLRLLGRLHGEVVFDDFVSMRGRAVRRSVSLAWQGDPGTSGVRSWHWPALWTPEQPNLYDLRLELVDPAGNVVDAVDSYFGVRKIEAENGRVQLNGRPYYQRLVLDQGYFPDGLLTAPSDDDLRQDIELAKELGFNGARKHQKVEDPRWLYWADRLGFLVWGEMANAYAYSPEYVRRITAEWQAVIRRDHNHPCIVAWVPMNESWGVPALQTDLAQTEHLLALYHLTHSLDGSRLVVSNDGWEHARTDLLTLHDYGRPPLLSARYTSPEASVASRPAHRPAYVPGYHYRGEPILITEFGGIALDVEGDSGGWGYSTVKDGDKLARRYDAAVRALLDSGVIDGFCYTQLTDVEQEINGLLTYDRKHKADPAAIREATARRRS